MKRTLLYALLFLCAYNATAQNQDTTFLLTISDSAYIPNTSPNGEFIILDFQQGELDGIASSYNIRRFQAVQEISDAEGMDNVYYVEANSANLLTDLTTAEPGVFGSHTFEARDCNTPGDAAYEQWLQTANKTTATPPDIYVQFYIVCPGGQGTAPISINDVNDAFNVMNSKFNGYINFIQCGGPKYLLNSYSVFPQAYPQGQWETEMYRQGNSPHAVDIYIFNQIGIGDIGGYTYLNGNAIYLAANLFNNKPTNLKNGLILSHEMAHKFGVMHTNGSGSGGTAELVNGTNSATTGDMIQDTPADPAWRKYLSNCAYPTFPSNPFNYCNPPSPYPSFCDANGSPYQPLSNNIMFPLMAGCTSFNSFTTGQLTVANMNADIEANGTYSKPYVDGRPSLMSADCYTDHGQEGCDCMWKTWWDVWESPDIWNCISGNNCWGNEKTQYLGASNFNYMRVRVRNIGCQTFPSGKADLLPYWTLGSTGEIWPGSWTTDQLCSLPAGGEILNNGNSGFPIPAIAGGGEHIVTIPWQPVDPTSYNCLTLVKNSDGKPMICLLSRIVSPNLDPIGIEWPTVKFNVIYNNNIATRNTSLLDINGNIVGPTPNGTATLLIQNPGVDGLFNLHLNNVSESERDYFQDGSIILTLSANVWNAWTNAGSVGSGFNILNASLHQLEITSDEAVLRDIDLPASDIGEAEFSFFAVNPIPYTDGFRFMLSPSITVENDLNQWVDEPVGTSCIFDVAINLGSEGKRSAKGEETIAAKESLPIKIMTTGKLKVYPNPADNELTISFPLDAEGSVEISITDIAGRVIEIIDNNYRRPGNQIIKADAGKYNSGIYLLKVKTANSIDLAKVVISR